MAKGTKTGGGSRKGRPNKVGKDVREMILESLELAGGVNYLVEQAQKNTSAYLSLVGKALPKNVAMELDNHINVNIAEIMRERREFVLKKEREQSGSTQVAQHASQPPASLKAH